RGRAGSGGGTGTRGAEEETGGFLAGDACSSRGPRAGPLGRAGVAAAAGFGAAGAGAGFAFTGSRGTMFSTGRREPSPFGGSALLGRPVSGDLLRSRTRGGGRSP